MANPRGGGSPTFTVEQIAQLVAEYTHRPLARFLGQPVVNIVGRPITALDALHRDTGEMNDEPLRLIEDRLLEQTPYRGS